MTESTGREPIRIANCSGFYGDRRSAAREMVEDGPIDALPVDSDILGLASIVDHHQERILFDLFSDCSQDLGDSPIFRRA